MSDILVTSPYRPFTLPNQFKAVFNGYIYCGTVDAVDPSVSQVQVYLVNESGDKVPVTQPLRTNAGGFLVYNGQPAKFVTSSNHSLLVRDSLGSQLWYAPNMADIDPAAASFLAIEALRRSYAEAGYNLVDGSFEAGGTLVNANDVLLQESTGKAFSGPAGSVSAGTNPASGGFVDVSDKYKDAPELNCEWFGVDVTGVNPSDDQLLLAMQASATSGKLLVTHGAVRLTRSFIQPINSAIRCDGVIFCDSASGIPSGRYLWEALVPDTSVVNTRIERLVLSTSPDLRYTTPDILAHGIKACGSKLYIGEIFTYGFQLGGIHVGPEGFEITSNLLSAYITQWNPMHKDAVGVRIAAQDGEHTTILTKNYPSGSVIGGVNHVNTIHLWGLPAYQANLYPNAQMLTGLKLGWHVIVDNVYIDTPDTSSYDAEPDPVSGDGYGVIFDGEESKIGVLKYRIHQDTKPSKVKLGLFRWKGNRVDYVSIGRRVDYNNPPAPVPFDYGNEGAKWGSIIAAANTGDLYSKCNLFSFPASSYLPVGVTAATGTLDIMREERELRVSGFYSFTSVNTSATGVFAIEVPSGIGVIANNYSGTITQRGGITSGTESLLTPFTNSGKIRVMKVGSGTQGSYVGPTDLKAGSLEFNIRIPLLRT